jgi:hypothetical protein
VIPLTTPIVSLRPDGWAVGGRLPITLGQIARLKAIGSSSELSVDPLRERYDQLKRYVEHRGNSMVPKKLRGTCSTGYLGFEPPVAIYDQILDSTVAESDIV